MCMHASAAVCTPSRTKLDWLCNLIDVPQPGQPQALLTHAQDRRVTPTFAPQTVELHPNRPEQARSRGENLEAQVDTCLLASTRVSECPSVRGSERRASGSPIGVRTFPYLTGANRARRPTCIKYACTIIDRPNTQGAHAQVSDIDTNQPSRHAL